MAPLVDFERVTPRQLGRARGEACSRPAAALRAARRGCREAAWAVLLAVGGAVVAAINAFLNAWAPGYQDRTQLPGRSRIGGVVATDGVSPPGRDVRIRQRAARYGPRRSESVDTILPCDRSMAAHRPAVLYVHGGGWIAANSACLLHSVAPIARAGFDVYSIDYPLASEVRFPGPLLSVLRAIAWIKKHEGHRDVILLGDSAGGNLVVMAAALACNRKLRTAFYETVDDAYPGHDMPHIVAVSSIYGIMDQRSWLADLPTISWLENKVTQFVIAFAFRMYRSRSNTFGNRFTIMDVLDDAPVLPPLQLQCGNKDILVSSNRTLYAALKRRGGVELDYAEFDTRHCFFGFPPQWLSEEVWQRGSREALRNMIRFFERHAERHHQARGRPTEAWVAPVTGARNMRHDASARSLAALASADE